MLNDSSWSLFVSLMVSVKCFLVALVHLPLSSGPLSPLTASVAGSWASGVQTDRGVQIQLVCVCSRYSSHFMSVLAGSPPSGSQSSKPRATSAVLSWHWLYPRSARTSLWITLSAPPQNTLSIRAAGNLFSPGGIRNIKICCKGQLKPINIQWCQQPFLWQPARTVLHWSKAELLP